MAVTRPTRIKHGVLRIVMDYDSDYKLLHTVDMTIFISIHSIILINFCAFLLKN
jgi:hypothetical protein